MRFVLSLASFSQFGGTETYAVTTAAELQCLGHEAVLYASELGPVAEVARAQGISVVDRLDQLPPTADALLAQDAGTAFTLAPRFPDAVRLLVAHSDFFPLQSPPQLAGVCDAVVVLNDRVRRRIEHLASAPPIVRLRQPVDLKRFGVRGGTDRRARRALLLGNYLRGPAAEAVEAACRAAGFEPMARGAQATPTSAPEQAIADADVVIGLGRCVVEAMAGRRAAYVYGIAGGDGWVTADRYAAQEADGFGGLADTDPIDGARMAAELAQWDPEMGTVNRQLACAHHDAALHAAALVDVVRDRMGGGSGSTPPPGSAEELGRLVRLEWQTWGRYNEALQELARLRAALDEVEDERDRAVRDHADAIELVDDFRRTLRYRTAVRIVAPLDALRRRRNR